MKNRFHILLLILAGGLAYSCGERAGAPSEADIELSTLLEEKDYFRLRDALEVTEDLTEERRLYYEAYLHNIFNDKELSNSRIETLFSRYGKKLSDSIKYEMLKVRAVNDLFLHRYADAAGAYREIIDGYGHILDEEQLEEVENDLALWGALTPVPAQTLASHSNTTIPSQRDIANYIIVPVTCNGEEGGFVFDTGANLSTVTQSTAERMGMTLYEAEINVGTATSIKVKSSLAVAEEFHMGELRFGNVVFLVVPDEMLTFPGYSIEGIIGMPVMTQMEEIHIGHDGGIFVPGEPVYRGLRNLCFEDLMPVVEMYSEGDSIIIAFDSGAGRTDLSARYLRRHRDRILEQGEYVERQRGGAGGAMTSKEYIIRDFPFTIGSRSGILESVGVSTEDNDEQALIFDGNLGQDIISQFDKMVLNFRHMFIDFE